ncbi:hypothetical protein D3872_13830 [Massilia cavernae]|uniref:NIPSNAP family containing protein n=2 Tax=Massilia cavernae TaxID=2320864 RepID=A0A418XRP6_9BURK|nr:hypothetical protein D3872_13830 [Massilia cavernae]
MTLWRKLALMCMTILAALCASAQAAPAASPTDAGTTTLVLEYHAAPANRLALRQFMQGEGLQQLERWKREGFLREYKVLFNRFVDNKNWDMLTLLNFPDAKTAAKWKEVEANMPAGLPPQALALVSEIDTNPGDLYLQGGTSKGSGVYVVIPYDYLVPTDKYLSYLRGYLTPQLDGWLKEGVLNQYSVYFGRYVVGRHWSALMIYEYNGDEGLGLREQTQAKVRATLVETNPDWVNWSKDKGQYRINRQYIIADELKAK